LEQNSLKSVIFTAEAVKLHDALQNKKGGKTAGPGRWMPGLLLPQADWISAL
jgi:hypothetical protein